jgi:RNA polymerase sigma factor (sigma-70 family)
LEDDMPANHASPTATRHRARTAVDELSDASLVALAGEGSREAWEELVARFSPLLRSITRRHRLSAADAADVTQVTWLQLYRHLDTLHDPARVAGWLASTARHECYRVIAHSRTDVVGLLDSGSDRNDRNDDLVANAEDPADVLLAGERCHAVRRAVRDLPRQAQELLRLLMWEDAPYRTVSEVMDMPHGSIGPTRERCLRSLARRSEIMALA